jgi:hypothetical protein
VDEPPLGPSGGRTTPITQTFLFFFFFLLFFFFFSLLGWQYKKNLEKDTKSANINAMQQIGSWDPHISAIEK